MTNLSDNAKLILGRLQELEGEDVTVHDLSEMIGLTVPQITGSFNSFVKKGIGFREEAEVEVDGEIKTVKFLKLTDEGKSLDI